MAHVSKRLAPKKQTQKPSPTIECVKKLSEIESVDDMPLVLRKRKVAPPSDETSVPQVSEEGKTNTTGSFSSYSTTY